MSYGDIKSSNNGKKRQDAHITRQIFSLFTKKGIEIKMGRKVSSAIIALWNTETLPCKFTNVGPGKYNYGHRIIATTCL